jgi:hypothetical protein
LEVSDAHAWSMRPWESVPANGEGPGLAVALACKPAGCCTVCGHAGRISGGRWPECLSDHLSLPGTIDAGGAPSMAEIAAKVAVNTPSDTSIRPPRPSCWRFEPKRTMTPGATKEQPPPCPIKEPLLPHAAPSTRRVCLGLPHAPLGCTLAIEANLNQGRGPTLPPIPRSTASAADDFGPRRCSPNAGVQI